MKLCGLSSIPEPKQRSKHHRLHSLCFFNATTSPAHHYKNRLLNLETIQF
ncbi:hypothetical protein HanXRQr2_Chr09g0371761 [Helianthus annuus]|uniref:Uncharacterized protein n=1 Tax=Helianthus annuus TaxID=4232 RepID=A0A9K3I2Z7_HELAN|nr:hypothetical protein HanXRQr2_Chr09g0371761 [Helianthus annuus]KAJ0891789.1 hypothetical protein HanPSC8_Chr09g0358211 [Helianthus annuus]